MTGLVLLRELKYYSGRMLTADSIGTPNMLESTSLGNMELINKCKLADQSITVLPNSFLFLYDDGFKTTIVPVADVTLVCSDEMASGYSTDFVTEEHYLPNRYHITTPTTATQDDYFWTTVEVTDNPYFIKVVGDTVHSLDTAQVRSAFSGEYLLGIGVLSAKAQVGAGDWFLGAVNRNPQHTCQDKTPHYVP
ncbi:hypothetical protein BC832DRAFT_538137 [Gaertneriomyces semiglobifer]|nr:hypothetical protein BC832DRAFT_538137 [Gaertneriomyces semiglobifer]